MSFETWTTDELCEKLEEQGFSEEVSYFKEANIDGSVLPFITEDMLKEIGISLIGPRVLINHWIRSTCGKTRAAAERQVPQQSLQSFDDYPPQKIPQNMGGNDMGTKIAKASAIPQAVSSEHRPPTSGRTKPGMRQYASEDEKPKFVKDHEKMVESIRAARRFMKYQNDLEMGRAVGPPPELPPIEEPVGLVACKYCGRKMSETAIRHHEPTCSRMNSGRSRGRGR